MNIDGKEFEKVCERAALPAGRSRLVYFDEERQVALFNVGGELFAVSNICPHQHAPAIADGFVENCTVTCPLHGWTYDLRSGQAVDSAAKLKKYDVRIIDDVIYVEVPPDEQPAWMKGF